MSSGPPRPLRVLLVPDFQQWILGTMAKAIAAYVPGVEATILSEGVMRDQAYLFPDLASNVDVVHFLREDSFNAHGKRFAGRPTVTAVHHVDSWEHTDPSLQADAVQYVSNQWRDAMVERGVDRDRLVYLPNGVDTDVFHPPTEADRRALRAAHGLDDDAFVVGFIAKRSSNTLDRKGADVFVAAITELVGRTANVAPLLVGPGWDDFVEALRAAGAQPVWHHFVADTSAFADIYRCMDVYWVTSRLEGGPVPLIEAMGSGVCCVSTPVGMAIDLLRDGENGFLTEIGDSDAVVERTMRLIEDESLRNRMQTAALATIRNGQQWKQVVQRAGELYRTAIDRFGQRTSGLPGRLADAREMLESADAPTPPTSDWLAAVPQANRRAVMTAEYVHWMHHLASMGELCEAWRYGLGPDGPRRLGGAALLSAIKTGLGLTVSRWSAR